MLSLLGNSGRLCDGVSRRELLTVGGLSFLGLSLPRLLRAEDAARSAAASAKQAGGANAAGGAVGANAAAKPGFGAADSVLFLYMQGSPSHIDLWDPKPEAPAEIRGEFQPIATSVPGIFLGDVLPKVARHADKFALVRSMGVNPKGLRNHGSSIYMLLTGHDPDNFSPTGLAVPPARDDLPALGAVVSRYRPAERGQFGYVAVCGPVKEGAVLGVGQSAGLLGPAHDPFAMYDDPTKPLTLDAFMLPAGVSSDRLQQRLDLRRVVAEQVRRGPLSSLGAAGSPGVRVDPIPAAGAGMSNFETYYSQALSLLQGGRAVNAFRLEEEPAALRAEYGMHRWGQSCLLARRLIEAGTRFVQVTWPARSDDEPAPGPDGSWDTHRNNFPTLRNDRCPVFDQTLSTLLADMHQRGLLKRTLLVVVGEFGRSPQLGVQTTMNVGPGGRDHWPECYTAFLAGGGVRPGTVYGESDRWAAFPKTEPVHPYDLLATIHHALGIDPASEYHDTLNRPRRLTQHGNAVVGLF